MLFVVFVVLVWFVWFFVCGLEVSLDVWVGVLFFVCFLSVTEFLSVQVCGYRGL